MKIITEQYGKMLLDLLVVASLMLLLFSQVTDDKGNRGIFQIMGAQLPAETEQDFSHEFDVYAKESQKPAPVIAASYGGTLVVGEYPLEELVSAVDWEGTALEVQLMSVSFAAGSGEAVEHECNTKSMLFEEAGIYTLRVMAVDAGMRRTVSLIRVPVNRE